MLTLANTTNLSKQCNAWVISPFYSQDPCFSLIAILLAYPIAGAYYVNTTDIMINTYTRAELTLITTTCTQTGLGGGKDTIYCSGLARTHTP